MPYQIGEQERAGFTSTLSVEVKAQPFWFLVKRRTFCPWRRETMDLLKRLQEYREQEKKLSWQSTFKDYFDLVVKSPSIAQLSHARIYSMILSAGEDTAKDGEKKYNFFSEDIFGLERTLQQLMEYFGSAARRLEVRKRILLFMGPVGGGKSTIVTLLKRGLEQYTRADEGGVYAIKGCPMHEEPL